MKGEKIATRQSFGEALLDIGGKNKNIIVLDADVSISTKTGMFAKQYPDRFFNIGISEQDLLGTAAGLSASGKIPYVSGYAIFVVGRAYDQIRNSICYPNLNVKICATHAGITVGPDGATHQMLEDIGIMRGLPNMTVISPSDDTQTKWIIEEISKINGPVYVRLTRPKVPVIYENSNKFEIGKGIQLGNGTDGTVIATGVCVNEALQAQAELKKLGINIRVVDIHTIKPIDKDLIIKCAKETKKMITVEDHSIIGGLGTAVCEVLAENYPFKVEKLGINDTFGKSGDSDELMEYFGINKKAIIDSFK